MNFSTAMFLIRPKEMRSVRVSYEPDVKGNPGCLFKTLDPDVKKGDLVVVPTETRHKMTVVKVEETDFVIDFDSSTEYKWIIGRVDTSTYEKMVEEEGKVIDRVRLAEQRRKQEELARALHIAEVDFSDLGIVKPGSALPAPAGPAGYEAPPEPPAT